ncbi:MAG: formylmethanofuran dehydrogenase subunit E family protein [Candidatus Bathyarchaeota archaeon]|nr:MAG: formylmethanofuran dehydrogenase subunit E family protein [Candidatus Bathyarchaeota archaeon]
MVARKQTQKQELATLIRKAAEFHGHLGPFLVLGVRMGLIGLRELGTKEDGNLQVRALLRDSVPFSCTIDGIQMATKCTIGNQKLKLIDSLGIAAEFQLQPRKKITVAVNLDTFNKLRSRLLEDIPPEEVRKLGWMVASMPEEQLFIIARG